MAKKKDGDANEERAGAGAGLWWAVIVALLLILFVVTREGMDPATRWWLVGVLFLGTFMAVGWLEKKRVWGIFINDRNLYSLSRLQVVFWSSLFFSALLVFFVVRWQREPADAFEIELDAQVVALAGISLGSFATATALVGAKVRSTVDEETKDKEAIETFKGFKQEYRADIEKQASVPKLAASTKATLDSALNDEDALQNLAVDEIKKQARGPLFGNRLAADAKWRDLIQGDELSNTRHTDLAKMQMLILTLLTFAGYALLVYNALSGYTISNCDTALADATAEPDDVKAACLAAFPPVSQGLALLLGASHAGYLINKGATHTKTI